MIAANDNIGCMFFLNKTYPVASVESCVMHINDLARIIIADRKDDENAAQFGTFNLSDYTPREQIALVLMRQYDDVAKAVLLRMKHSTAGGPDWERLRLTGLAVWNIDKNLHDATPRGRWIAGKVAKALAEKFEIKPTPRAITRVYSNRSSESIPSQG